MIELRDELVDLLGTAHGLHQELDALCNGDQNVHLEMARVAAATALFSLTKYLEETR